MGSIFFLILIIANQFYTMRYNYEYDKVVSDMKMKANTMSSQIIMRHMDGKKFNKNDYTSDIKCTLELYDKKGKSLLSNIKENVDLHKSTYIKDNYIYLIYDGTFDHLGINKIVLRDNLWMHNNKLLQTTVIVFSIVFIFMTIIGYFLGKLFLKPILIQRKKLDLFIKDTTHELNTPITALLMSINKKDPTSEINIKRINLSAKRISEIYNDLTYLFLENETKHNEILDLKKTLEENIEYFVDLAQKKKINMICNFEESSYNIDKESFSRLTNNLISNALKYTNIDGSIEITLNKNSFIVKDNGIGISKNKQKDIFDRFYRATSNSGGFGIGLDIVSSICKKYDISIAFESKENIGTEFTLTFIA
jgi:two-component system OmpR family sensor kinase